MTEDGIRDLVRVFVSPAFTLEVAERVLGPATKTEEHWITLRPRDPDLAGVTLETDRKGPKNELFVSGIDVRLGYRSDVRFDLLRRWFGEPRQNIPRKPHSPVPYQFDLPNLPYSAYLVVSVLGWEETDTRPVVGVRVRRFYPTSSVS